ncbi:FUSC family protein [Micrococcus porci]|uniref:FUSC family protein n=1 Tax=Micrococcus TaxID=1269 RepID=UPI001CCCE807|nr:MULTISPECIES: FUSC family protein [Micrococcus]MCG7422790.1 FUSC family protein [Micrococcus sp. ACRRV]UBH24833.1 FUSC family protein [Micrococcus porci]
MTDRHATATGTLPAVPAAAGPSGVGRFLRRRARAGWSRLRSSVGHAALMAVCAVGAYWFAETVLGHAQPLFAATALLIALGFQREPRVRKVAEVAFGCTLGILIGDLMMAALGRGLWQAVLVVFVSVLAARFLDSGATFTMQMSLQSVLVVLLPLNADGPFARSADALVGGLLALLVTLLSPRDPTRLPARQLRGLYESMASVLRELSAALRAEESRTAWMALVECRRTQSTLEDVRKELKVTREQTVLNPLQRPARDAADVMAVAADRSDLAVRSLRIVARRVVSILDHGAVDGDHRERLAAWFDDAADAVEILHRSLAEPQAEGRHRSLDVARDALGASASWLDPHELAGGTVHGEALVMLLRPMMVDLIEATGASHAEALTYLPRV